MNRSAAVMEVPFAGSSARVLAFPARPVPVAEPVRAPRPGAAPRPQASVRPVSALPVSVRPVSVRPPSVRPVSVRPVSARRYAVRRVVGVVVLGALSMLVVVALGLIAEAAAGAQARTGVSEDTAVVAVQPGETVWEVARRAAPEARTTAVVERIVADNGLTGPVDAVLPAGLSLRVPS